MPCMLGVGAELVDEGQTASQVSMVVILCRDSELSISICPKCSNLETPSSAQLPTFLLHKEKSGVCSVVPRDTANKVGVDLQGMALSVGVK